MGMGEWGWDNRNGIMGMDSGNGRMGEWEWENGNGRMGMGEREWGNVPQSAS